MLNYIDSKYSRLHISRRGFLKTAAMAAAASMISCEKEKPLDDIIDPPVPLIAGPTELTIPRVGMGVSGTFDSIGTKGATELYWQNVKPLSLVDTIEQFGSESKVNINFAIPGDNIVNLIADNAAGRSKISQNVKINPPNLPEKNYDMPMLLMVRELKTSNVYGVYTLDIKTNELTKLFSGRKYYDYINWEPTGQRMVFTSDPDPEDPYPESPYKLTTYDFTTGVFRHISNNNSGIVWAPKWSPKGDWIAYLDDSKSIKHGVDAIALVRPDGSQQFYLDGVGESSVYSALSLSWDPEGKRLIAETGAVYRMRYVIFDDLFSGKAKVSSRLPTDEQVGRLYDRDEKFRQTYSRDFVSNYAYCIGGVAWSPDGQYMAYGLGVEYYRGIFVSRVDGTGEIEKVADSIAPGFDANEFHRLRHPTWTPDGSAIYFTANNYNVENLFKYDMSTKKCEQVKLPISGITKASLYG